jgi:20S proteasome alpha/beta subunit
MTLVVAAPGSDFVILGADSRGTIQDQGGTRVEINIVKKLIPVSDRVAIMVYGAANESIHLVERFQSSHQDRSSGVTEIANDFAAFCRDEARLLADVPREYNPSFGFVIAGLDKQGRRYVPRAHSLRSGNGYWLGSYPHYAVEGKPMIALYLFTTYYREGMTFEELCKLVAVVLNETRKIDGDVGGRLRMAAIDMDGFREISNQDIRGYIREWEKNRLIRNEDSSDQILADDETVT